MARAPGETVEVDPVWEAREQRVRLLVEEHLPQELRGLALDLMSSLRNNAGVAERFDAFCVQAFSKPDWAMPASAVIGELFEDDEDRLAELARVPDLVIELGCGQAAVACTVASKWAARGETHRLARLAESIIAAHGTMRNAAAVEVMLALAGTLAISRPSRAEQLFNTALPGATEENADAVADARSWLDTGKAVCGDPQEIRDLWDTRLRRPRTAWKWETDEERKALTLLADELDPQMPGIERYKRVVPACWWELAVERARMVEKHEKQSQTAADGNAQPAAAAEHASSASESPARPTARTRWGDDLPPGVDPSASGAARVVLGWAAGVFMMAVTALIAPDGVHRLVMDIRSLFVGKPAVQAAPASSAVDKPSSTPTSTPAPVAKPAPKPPAAQTQADVDEENRRWRAANVKSMAAKNQALADVFLKVKNGKWSDVEMILGGHSQELPYSSEGYMQLLVWLHVDPPADADTQARLPKLLLERQDAGVLSFWEKLIYPGSPNADSIRRAAREALGERERTWSFEDTQRLRHIAGIEDSEAAK